MVDCILPWYPSALVRSCDASVSKWVCDSSFRVVAMLLCWWVFHVTFCVVAMLLCWRDYMIGLPALRCLDVAVCVFIILFLWRDCMASHLQGLYDRSVFSFPCHNIPLFISFYWTLCLKSALPESSIVCYSSAAFGLTSQSFDCFFFPSTERSACDLQCVGHWVLGSFLPPSVPASPPSPESFRLSLLRLSGHAAPSQTGKKSLARCASCHLSWYSSDVHHFWCASCHIPLKFLWCTSLLVCIVSYTFELPLVCISFGVHYVIYLWNSFGVHHI